MVSKYIALLFLCVTTLSAEEPWGKDADLISLSSPQAAKKEAAGFEAIVHFHQRVISLADGPRSHFKPSSSAYALQAIQRYGFLKGFSMGCDRLLRENSERGVYPLVKTKDGDYLKWDPVR